MSPHRDWDPPSLSLDFTFTFFNSFERLQGLNPFPVRTNFKYVSYYLCPPREALRIQVWAEVGLQCLLFHYSREMLTLIHPASSSSPKFPVAYHLSASLLLPFPTTPAPKKQKKSGRARESHRPQKAKRQKVPLPPSLTSSEYKKKPDREGPPPQEGV